MLRFYLERLEAGIRIKIVDEGVGFDDEQAGSGFGLVTMKDRAEALGGKLRVDSQRGTGMKWSSSCECGGLDAGTARVDRRRPRADTRRRQADMKEADMVVCAEAADAAHAVQKALETRADVCLLDVRMPGGGVAAAWEVAARLPTTKVVMLTVSDQDGDLCGALRAGAVSYLVKDIDLSALPQACATWPKERQRSLPARRSIVLQFHSNDPRFRTTQVGTELGPRLTSRECGCARCPRRRALDQKSVSASSSSRAACTHISARLSGS